MRKILNIFEQEDDDVELNDYEKILALNKKKIDADDVEFTDSEGNRYDDVIEVKQDGLYFDFNGLDDFLRFFFHDTYGDEGGDGWYEAGYLDSMYRGNWDYDFWDRASEDWSEGIILESLKGESLNHLYQIIRIAQPSLLGYFFVDAFGNASFKDADYGKISDALDVVSPRLADDLQSAFVDGSYAAISGEVPKYLEKTYCNGLADVGIENYSSRSCFWKYYLPWGSAIMFFVRYGTTEDSLLDLMFKAIETEFTDHVPEYYEIQYNVWDNGEFDRVFNNEAERSLYKALSQLEEDMTDNGNNFKKYLKIIDKINDKIGFRKWVSLPDKKFSIYIDGVDKKTLKISYNVKENSTYYSKRGLTTIDALFNLLNNPSLFSPMEYRNH